MIQPGPDPSAIPGYYNAGEVANGVRPGPGGQPGNGGNHALQDYQMQLMLLEQQNKKRLLMARAEADGIQPRPDGQGGPAGGIGPNGQPFQGASPQGARNSPGSGEQIKRGTPHMNPAGIPSPLPEGQNRASPGAMNFNMPGGGMDPNMGPQFYKMNGMEGPMAGPNGMRPPSSHPNPAFNGQMPPQQQQQQKQQQQHQARPRPTPMAASAPGSAPGSIRTSTKPAQPASGVVVAFAVVGGGWQQAHRVDNPT